MSSVIIAGDTSGTVTLQAPAVAGSTVLTLPAVTGNIPVSSYTAYTGGITPNTLMYRLNADLAGANATGAQSIFGVGVTLLASTQYEFETVFVLAKTAGTTSHTVSIGFGGTATLNNIIWNAVGAMSAQALPFYGTGGASTILAVSNSNAALVTSGARTSAIDTYQITVRGSVSINAGGTFTPQYTLSAAPGGAYSTVAGSYMKISPISASGSNTIIGTWA
jgi:hypothetical protein